jgi:hypothetical protein
VFRQSLKPPDSTALKKVVSKPGMKTVSMNSKPLQPKPKSVNSCQSRIPFETQGF